MSRLWGNAVKMRVLLERCWNGMEEGILVEWCGVEWCGVMWFLREKMVWMCQNRHRVMSYGCIE